VEEFEKQAQLLPEVIFRTVRDDGELQKIMHNGDAELSWLNKISATSVRSEVQIMIDRLFRSNVPRGWSEWGFKEILYGFDNNAPAVLLDLFPHSRGAFVFRRPFETIVSMVETWDRNLLRDASCINELAPRVDERIRRWQQIVSYFIDLRRRSDRLFFISAESMISASPREVITALNLEKSLLRTLERLDRTNPGSAKLPNWAQNLIEQKYASVIDRFNNLYQEALSSAVEL
jgi:hypothetical protein